MQFLEFSFIGQDGGLGQAPLLVGILLVLVAVVLASLIHR
jgi:melanocyte protein PMEL